MRFNRQCVAVVAAAAALTLGTPAVMLAAAPAAVAVSDKAPYVLPLSNAVTAEMNHAVAGETLTFMLNFEPGDKRCLDGTVELSGTAASITKVEFKSSDSGNEKVKISDGGKKLTWSWRSHPTTYKYVK